jgi:UDP-N-acetylglucosamine 4,6-dehydratase
MQQNIKFSIIELEKRIISNKDRYKLNVKENNEIKKTLFNQNLLIIGACGSIGKLFTKRIYKFNFKNIYLLDKNENALVELNRDLVLLNNKKIKQVNFICTDITSFNLDDFLSNNKINQYYNFAAMKHVRSEEYLDSLKYMFKTNSVNFCPNKKNYLKIFFSISSDKAVLPQSFLGISKYFMEEKLANFAKKNKSVSVSTVRFANVCFSEGSYLKYAKERIEKKISFGLPLNIKRYFITHNESISLCFKSILKKNKNKIIMPSDKIMNKEYKLSFIIKKLLNLYGYKIKYSNKILSIKKNIFPVVVSRKGLEGQKDYEEFYDKNLNKVIYDKDKQTMKIDLINNINVDSMTKKLPQLKSKNEIIKLIQKKIKKFKPNKHTIKVSHLI